ncbi:hypothetical protein BGZ95_001386 [Linnemannia exigua]|uniref:Cystatin domain-containing protein n=1 Tax=Linnemannia exigua TaxID=604196 RepID=A0AAD4H433_9FUNG|nr:hypothetical protein BGZ95_001386 [Linnemannia exigua]
MSHTVGSLGGPGIRTVGGIGGVKPINKDHPLVTSNPDLHKILIQLDNPIRDAYTKMSTADSVLTFEPVSYASQTVAGTNFYVKLKVHHEGGKDDAEYIHVKIFDQPWTETLKLTGIDAGKTLDEPFQYDMPAPPE